MNTLIVINFIAGLTVFLFACGELAEKRRPLTTPSAWIYMSLTVSALAVMAHGAATGQPHNPTEVFFNTAVALHLARKMWEGWQKHKAKAIAAVPSDNPPPAPPKTKPAKPNRRTRRKRRR